MLLSDSYFTIAGEAEGVFKDRGSKFLAFAYPVKTEAEIKNHLQLLRKAHPSAAHHCYAWRLGAGKTRFRANDDGEPSGTAGKPILSQIKARELSNVLVVVLRYFGGTLLGTSGLINAYREATADALDKAEIQEQFIFSEYRIEFDFDVLSRVMRLLKEYKVKIVLTDYVEKSTIVFQVRKTQAKTLEGKFRDLHTTKLECLHLTDNT